MKVFIKTIHTFIWAIMVVAIFYMLYSGIVNEINIYTWSALGLLVIEILALLMFKWSCPLTLVYKKYSDNKWESGDDIFLPEWLARHNKTIFGALLTIALILMLYRLY